MGLDQVRVCEQGVRGSKAFRYLKLPWVSINRDDRHRASKTCALNSRESHRTASNDGDAAAKPNLCYIANRSDAGHHSTTDLAGNVERNAFRNPHSAVFSDDRKLRKGPGVHQLMNRLLTVKMRALPSKCIDWIAFARYCSHKMDCSRAQK